MELKPCPFCGGTPLEVDRTVKMSGTSQIEVNATIQCLCCGVTLTKEWYEKVLQSNECYLNNETVYDLWNRRVDNG